MKPLLLFTFITISASFFSCFRLEDKAPKYPKKGNWPVVNIEETKFDTLNKPVGITIKSYQNATKAFAFTNTDYIEFENYKEVRSGNFIETDGYKKMVVVMGKDSVKLEILSISDKDMLLKTEEKTASGSTLRMITSSRN